MNKKSSSKGKRRIDAILVEKSFVSSVVEAQAFILSGKVLVNEQKINKPSDLIAENSLIRIKSSPQYVSRGGDKLHGAITDLGLIHQFKDAVILDFGASTGGFTDCALQSGARKVYALDIGTNQLAWKLRSDPRVHCMEQTDIRTLDDGFFSDVTLVVADISFNSLATLLRDLIRVLGQLKVSYLLLVKPQFELPRTMIPEGGVIINQADRELAVRLVKEAFVKQGFPEGISIDSQVEGRTGNREIFYYVAADPDKLAPRR